MLGARGVFSSMPHYDYRAVKVDQMTAALNAANLIIVMLETPAAIDNADAIAAVDGIDVLLIGTKDLCIEMGVPGDLAHAKVDDAYSRMVAAGAPRAQGGGERGAD